MGKAIFAVSISPLGEGPSVSDYVAEAIKVLKEDGRVEWELGPMFTTVWGEPEVVFDVILKMREAVFRKGAKRVSVVIKMDERRDREVHPREKVDSVLKKLAHT